MRPVLLAIALMPFINLHWWERHFPKVAVGLGTLTTVYYVFFLGNGARMLHVGHEYASFFTYVFKYALPILIPLMVIISLLFFSRWRVF